MPSERHQFYRTAIQLTIPVTIQNIFMSSLNLVDTVMVGQLGAIEVAAVGQANRFSFILIIILFAISSGAAIFTAQYWGKKDVVRIGNVMAIALTLNLLIAAGFGLAALLYPQQLMYAFSKDPQLIATGAEYLRFVAPAAVFSVIPMLYSFVLRSIENVKLPMYASILSLSTNTALNYCLIFGKFGFPALGVKGAAIATVISRMIETSVMLWFGKNNRRPLIIWRDFKIKIVLIRQFVKTALPVVINEAAWVLAVTMYAVVYGRMGTSDVAAMTILNPLEQIASSFFFGISSATATMVGNKIGAGENETAYLYAKRFAIITPLGAMCIGGLLALTAPYAVRWFKVPAEVQTLSRYCLYVLSAVLWMKMFNMITIVGVLRGGGDTKFSMYIEICAIWLIGVPAAFLGGLVWKLPIYTVYAMTMIEELCKMLLGIQRIISRKWIHNLTH